MSDIYVYYHCPGDSISNYKELGLLLIERLTTGTTIQAGLYRKKGPPQTLMEVYRDVGNEQTFCELMATEAVSLYKKHMATIPDRHIEIFSAL